MKKNRILGLIGLAMLTISTDAQNYQDISRTTAVAVRDPARQASTEIDAVIYNPAGTALLSDGWHFSLNANLSTQQVDESSYGRSNHNLARNIIPSLQSAYKKGRLTFSLSLGNESGFGVWKQQENSLLTEILDKSWEQPFSSFADLANTLGTGSKYDELRHQAYVSGHLYNFAGRIGAAYKIDDHWSVYAGLRVNYYHEKTKTDVWQFVQTSNTAYVPINKYFTDLDNVSKSIIDEYIDLADISSSLGIKDLTSTDNISEIQEEASKMFKAAADSKQVVTLVDKSNSGWGISPIIGVDYHIGALNFGAKYEFETKIHVGDNGHSFHLPGVLSGGMSWQIRKDLKASIGGSWMHQKTSTLIGNNQKVDTSDKDLMLNIANGDDSNIFISYAGDEGCDSYEASASLAYSPIDKLTISVGYTHSKEGMLVKSIYPQSIYYGDKYVDIVSGGFRYEISDNVQLDLGVSKKKTNNCDISPNDKWGGLETLAVSAGINVNL